MKHAVISCVALICAACAATPGRPISVEDVEGLERIALETPYAAWTGDEATWRERLAEGAVAYAPQVFLGRCKDNRFVPSFESGPPRQYLDVDRGILSVTRETIAEVKSSILKTGPRDELGCLEIGSLNEFLSHWKDGQGASPICSGRLVYRHWPAYGEPPLVCSEYGDVLGPKALSDRLVELEGGGAFAELRSTEILNEVLAIDTLDSEVMIFISTGSTWPHDALLIVDFEGDKIVGWQPVEVAYR